jgi:GDP-4-dehydro-6-deoxy-D-mannose reductase
LFNVASGQPRRIGDLLDVMVHSGTCPVEVAVDPTRFRQAEIPRAVGDARALCQQLGWSPRHSVDELVRGLLIYWRGKISGRNSGS